MITNYIILVCTLFVSFTQTLKAPDYGSIDNIEDVPTIDGVSDYEVVPVRHMLHKRSINELTIQTKINGENHEIYLQPTEGLLAGTETKIFTATRNGQNNVNFKFLPSVMEKIFLKFYQDPKTSSSISHSVNEEGQSEFNGIINDNMVIRPMPQHLRKRRDLLYKNYSRFENEAEGFINTNEHIIYKQNFKNASHFSTVQVNHEKMEIKSISRRSIMQLPSIVYPEIMVFVDDVLFRKLNYDVVRAVEYTLSFWNAVDLRYREFEKPKIRLNIAGIVLVENLLPFVNEAIYNLPAGEVDNHLLLDGFASFLRREKQIQPKEDYDVAMFVTGRDMVITKTHEKSVSGLAFLGGVCEHGNGDKYISSGIIEDSNGYGGIITAAHELAHILGAPHDEEDSKGKLNYDTKLCSKKEGYIMSYNRHNENRILFSPCSKQAIQYILSQDFAECIRNNPAEYKNNRAVPRVLPGQIMSLDEQCKMLGYIRYHAENSTCLELHCVSKINENGSFRYTTSYMPPAEGSTCGNGKHCLAGECVNTVRNLPQQQNPQQIPKKLSTLKAPIRTTPKAPITSKVTRVIKTKTCINGECSYDVKEDNNDNSNNFQNYLYNKFENLRDNSFNYLKQKFNFS